MTNPLTIEAKAQIAGGYATAFLGLTIPISVALDNILLALIAVLWLVSGNWRTTPKVLLENPVAFAAVALFGLLTIGTAYGSGSAGILVKYADLLFLPIFLTFFQQQKIRERALDFFCIAAFASIVVSHLASLDLLGSAPWLTATDQYATGFKRSITHSLIVAMAAYVLALLAREERNSTRRLIYIALALVAVHNVIFMIIGRIAYLVLVLLFFYYFVVTFGRRGLLVFALVAAVTLVAAYTASSTFQRTLTSAASQLAEWQAGKPSATSVGMRAEFYLNSLELVREHPLVGTGTGSFPSAYAQLAAERNMIQTSNPHNEYLLITVQLGLIGLASLIYLFYCAWRNSRDLRDPLYRDVARGLVLTFVAGCLFNSLLHDHTEGLLFAWLSALAFAAPRRQQSTAASEP